MRRNRAAHDIERVAVAALFGVNPRQHLQRLDLGVVAAPDGGQRFQFARDLVALEIAERVAQQRLVQPPLCRGRAIPGIRRNAVGAQRIVAVADTFSALTSRRPWRDAASVSIAVEQIEKESGFGFEPKIVGAFRDVMPELLDIRAEVPDLVPAK